MDKKQIENVKNIDGWLSDNEITYLFNEAYNVKNNFILEIGNYRGKSTLALAYGAEVPVYTIDPHRSWKQDGTDDHFSEKDRVYFFQNLLKYEVVENVRPIELKSEVVAKGWDKELSFIFVDGDHSYEGCKTDADCWTPYLKDGGIIAFHDADKNHVGVNDVVNELTERNFEVKSQVDSIVSLEKHE